MKRLTLSQQDSLLGIVLILPILAFVLVFAVWPLINTIRLGFYHYNLLQPDIGEKWVGLGNYSTLIDSGDLIPMWWRTTLIAFSTISGQIALGLIIALMLNHRFFGRAIVRSTFVVPWALPTLVAAFAIRWVFDANFGPLNQFLSMIGFSMNNFPWLGRPDTAMGVVISAHIWKGLGYTVLVMLAGLQTIPVDLREAAKVDGANAWQEFVKVVLPHLRYIIAITFILRFIWTFNWFDFVWLTTSGGPARATMTLPVAVYITAFKSFNMGRAASIATVMAVTLAIFSFVFIRLAMREEEA